MQTFLVYGIILTVWTLVAIYLGSSVTEFFDTFLQEIQNHTR